MSTFPSSAIEAPRAAAAEAVRLDLAARLPMSTATLALAESAAGSAGDAVPKPLQYFSVVADGAEAAAPRLFFVFMVDVDNCDGQFFTAVRRVAAAHAAARDDALPATFVSYVDFGGAVVHHSASFVSAAVAE